MWTHHTFTTTPTLPLRHHSSHVIPKAILASLIDHDSLQTDIHTLYIFLNNLYSIFRWSRGSMLAFSTQVRGFKPSRSLRIFKGENILSTPSFREEVQPSVPCHRFAACKRSLNGVEVVFSAKLPDNIIAHSSHFRHWDLSCHGGRGGTWW